MEVREGQAMVFGLDVLGLVVKRTVVCCDFLRQTSSFDDSTSFSARLRILQIALQVAIMNLLELTINMKLIASPVGSKRGQMYPLEFYLVDILSTRKDRIKAMLEKY